LGYVWVDTPLYQISRIIGPHGVTLFTLVMAAIITRIPKPAQIVMLMAVAIAPFLPTPQGPKPAAGAPIARLIHPNVVQQDKLNPDLRETLYQKQLALAALGPAVDLIILPETAIYLPMHIAAPEIADIAQGAHVFAGAQRRDGAGYYYNAGHMLTPDATVSHIYDKARLVPFGEYIPLGDWLETWGIYGLAARDVGFSKGPGPQVLTVPAIGKIHPLICYEGIFPHFVAATDNRPDMIVLITNDGWFGSVNGPAQHFAQARARAIELGLPILRVANRGVTGVIDARGFVPVSTQDYTATALDVAIPPAAPATLYSTWRDIPFIAILCILCLMGVGRRRLFH
ncbi:MAG: apolipoprotein N-acyltransferase, partial [Pseudomonadota bacterium]